MCGSTIANTVSSVEEVSASSDFFLSAFQQFDALVAWAQGSEGTLSEVEQEVGQRGRRLLRAVIQGHLDLRAVKEKKMDAVQGVDEIRRTQRRSGEHRTIGTLFGEVKATRTRYETKEKSVASLCPLDGELNLADQKYSHQVAKRIAHNVTMGSFENTIETLEQTSGISVPKRQVEQLVQNSAVDFTKFYEQRPAGKIKKSWTDSTITVLTTDGKGIHVYPQDLREVTRKKIKKELGDGLYFRKRMAQVASVYHVEPYQRTAACIVSGLMGTSNRVSSPRPKRPKPKDKRVWASIVDDAEKVIESIFDEAVRRDPDFRTTWVAVVDGAEHQLEMLKESARARDIDIVIICDIIHVLGYLWEAAKALFDDQRRQRRWVKERLYRLLRGEVSQVAAGIRRAKTMRRRKLKKAQRKALDTCADYLLNHKNYLRYDRYIAAGFPVSSGVIEGTVRHLVNDRMAITGAHWRLSSAEAVLRLRALRCTGDFEDYWDFHERRERYRNHLCKYSGEKLPSNSTFEENQRGKPILRLVS
jgi:hypothetical protein